MTKIDGKTQGLSPNGIFVLMFFQCLSINQPVPDTMLQAWQGQLCFYQFQLMRFSQGLNPSQALCQETIPNKCVDKNQSIQL